MFRSIQIPLAVLMMGSLWAIFSDPIITLFFDHLTISKQDTFRSVNDFVFVILISIYLFFEIRRQQRKLSKSEGEYRDLFESNPNPMWIYEIDTCKFIKVNNAAIAKYGYDRKQFSKMTIYDIRHEQEHHKVKNFVNEVREGVKHSGIWEHLKANGQTFKVAIISHPVDFENKKCSFVMANDISQLLDKKQKLREANKKIRKHTETLSQINWSNSHELRKPLCSILSLVDLLKSATTEAEKEEYLAYLEQSSAELDDVFKKNNERLERVELYQ